MTLRPLPRTVRVRSGEGRRTAVTGPAHEPTGERAGLSQGYASRVLGEPRVA
ncbi:hypothetical protein ACWD4X_31150 [Streptomyces termitum]